ncbi:MULTISPECIES: LysR family transcriptional regulator [Kitasatospora]|uniref:Putative LysR family transcriptional regulator n=1 Tax=Kitasatospora setae (strain ATCC 33774 / DSM 43861 / JCM 3304 / KCC A-0304 / NBRC 14216 / KM-6054) TaxID=452652 RepID=E4NDM0_KITSK|nr:LysR family transcriptional regulator [Kitasatospora setae]BAJ29301.1 putative LysR family transcriptional regulator [Kitasatospora setae KM-6054]
MARDIHPRLLRSFVAVAESLHFGRAAGRLHLAQQAVSRDVRALERELGCVLLLRSTRSVELTEAGAALLPKARRLLEVQAEITALGGDRAVLVDLNSQGWGPEHAAERVLAAARRRVPEVELLARYCGGLTAAAGELAAHRLDASFGRYAGLPAVERGRLAHLPVRLEPLAVYLPAGHPLAGMAAVPLAALAGHPVDVFAGQPATAEWTDLGTRLLAGHGLAVAPGRTPPVGAAEFARYLARHGDPVLTAVGAHGFPGAVVRPLVEPVPLSLVGLVHRPGAGHPGLAALRACAVELAAAEGWLRRPPGSWLPAEDAALLGG